MNSENLVFEDFHQIQTLIWVQLCLWWLFRIFEKSRVQVELRCVTDHWNQGGARSAAVLKRGVHETMGSSQWIFQSLKDRSTTSYKSQPLHSPNEKEEFLCFLKLESKLVPVDKFLFSESVYISFTTSSRSALLWRFITGNCKPCFISHIFRHPSSPCTICTWTKLRMASEGSTGYIDESCVRWC